MQHNCPYYYFTSCRRAIIGAKMEDLRIIWEATEDRWIWLFFDFILHQPVLSWVVVCLLFTWATFPLDFLIFPPQSFVFEMFLCSSAVLQFSLRKFWFDVDVGESHLSSCRVMYLPSPVKSYLFMWSYYQEGPSQIWCSNCTLYN